LTPAYSTNRKLSEYIGQLYLPAASEFHRRTDDAVARLGMPITARSAAVTHRRVDR